MSSGTAPLSHALAVKLVTASGGGAGGLVQHSALGFVIAFVVVIVGALAGGFSTMMDNNTPSAGGAIILIVCGLALLGLYVAWIVVMCIKGTRGPNRYGPDPLYPQADAEVF